MFLWSWDGNGDCPTVQRSYRKHSSDTIPPDNLGPFHQCTPGRGKVEVRLPWATSGYCFSCLLPKLAFDYAAGITAQGKHSPGKACRSPDDGHTSLGANGGEHSGVCRWLCMIFFQKKTHLPLLGHWLPWKKSLSSLRAPLCLCHPKELKLSPPEFCKNTSPCDDLKLDSGCKTQPQP